MFEKIYRKVFSKPLKNQMITLFLPVTLIIVLIFGLCSYFFAIRQVKQNASYLIDSAVMQVSSLMDDKMTTIFTQLVRLCDSTAVGSILINNYEPQEMYKKYNDILECQHNMENIYYTYSNMVDSVYFRTNTGTELTVFKDQSPANTDMDLGDWLRTYNTDPHGYYWLNIHDDAVFKTQYQRRVLSVFKNVGSEQTISQALILFNLDPNYFKRILDNTEISRHGYMMLISGDNAVSSANADEEYQLTNETLAQLQSKTGQQGDLEAKSCGGNSVVVTYHPLSINGWLVAAVVPQQDLTDTFGHYKYIVLALMVFLMLILTALCILFARNISRPMEFLSNKVKRFEQGDKAVDFTANISSNEIGVLANGLNSLKRTVGELVEQVRLEQVQKSKVELLAMQSQIKPHFLYNTLGSIKHLIDMGDNAKASKMCGDLSKFYMLGISGGREIITVQEEVEHVRNYLEIQQMRYQKDFDFYIDMEDDILTCRILKLTIQPIIENAIYHGIKTKAGKGNIILTGKKEENNMVFEVYDDGAGMTDEQLEELRASIAQNCLTEHPKNFGLRNVNMRLKLYFGEGAHITFDSAKDVYTQVRIVIPICSD